MTLNSTYSDVMLLIDGALDEWKDMNFVMTEDIADVLLDIRLLMTQEN